MNPSYYRLTYYQEWGPYGFETGGQFNSKMNPGGPLSRAIFSIWVSA